MTLRHIFCAVLVALFGFGCGNSRSRAIDIVREVGFNELRLDLTLAAAAAGTAHEIPQSEWSEYVRRFRPVAVQRHMGGVLIVISRVGREQEGLLVMLNRDNPGSGGSGASYDKIRDGLFWCVEKIRDPYIPLEQRTNR